MCQCAVRREVFAAFWLCRHPLSVVLSTLLVSVDVSAKELEPAVVASRLTFDVPALDVGIKLAAADFKHPYHVACAVFAIIGQV